MRIVFFETEPWEQQEFRESLPEHDCVFTEEPLSEQNAVFAKDADIISVFVYSSVTEPVLNACPKVRLISTRSMGYDHIQMDACKRRGIPVVRVPAYGERTVAEHTFGLMLGLSRNIYSAYERTEQHDFDYRGLTGFDLYGKTLGIIGCGTIGKTVATIAIKGFGMRVIVSDPNEDKQIAESIGFSYADMQTLCAEADIITLHAPLTPKTTHMINDAAIGTMKRGVMLINTARGGLIDTAALLRGLETGIVAGAGLDVLEEEFGFKEEYELLKLSSPAVCDIGAIVRNHMLIKRDDVIITPHIGFNSKEAMQTIRTETVEHIRRFSKGEPVQAIL